MIISGSYSRLLSYIFPNYHYNHSDLYSRKKLIGTVSHFWFVNTIAVFIVLVEEYWDFKLLIIPQHRISAWIFLVEWWTSGSMDCRKEIMKPSTWIKLQVKITSVLMAMVFSWLSSRPTFPPFSWSLVSLVSDYLWSGPFCLVWSIWSVLSQSQPVCLVSWSNQSLSGLKFSLSQNWFQLGRERWQGATLEGYNRVNAGCMFPAW